MPILMNASEIVVVLTQCPASAQVQPAVRAPGSDMIVAAEDWIAGQLTRGVE